MPIRQLRERLGMSMAELAEKMGVTVATVSRWETGEALPVTSRLGALADALHCTIDALYGRGGHPDIPDASQFLYPVYLNEEEITMPEENRNTYKTYRKAAGFTQEAAAERLGISVESLRAYETGQRIPSNDVVELMSILYNDLSLIVRHVHSTNNLYNRVVPDIQPKSVLEASAKLTNRIFDFAASHADRRLLRIAEDNVIDDGERAEFDAIMEDLQEIVEAALELRCARESS